jgi:hypothetical protein
MGRFNPRKDLPSLKPHNPEIAYAGECLFVIIFLYILIYPSNIKNILLYLLTGLRTDYMQHGKETTQKMKALWISLLRSIISLFNLTYDVDYILTTQC